LELSQAIYGDEASELRVRQDLGRLVSSGEIECRLSPLFGICFDDKCDRPDRPRLCREGEKGAPPDARSREADLALEAGFVHVKARQAFPEIGRQVRRREQTAFRASR
jgi:hypothetical protein